MPPRTSQRIPYRDCREQLGDHTDRQKRGTVNPVMLAECSATDEEVERAINGVEVQLLMGRWTEAASVVATLGNRIYLGTINGPRLSSVNARYVAYDLVGYWLRKQRMVSQAVNVLEWRARDPDLRSEPVTRDSSPAALELSQRTLLRLDLLHINTVGQLSLAMERWYGRSAAPQQLGNVELAAIYEELDRHGFVGVEAKAKRLESKAKKPRRLCT